MNPTAVAAMTERAPIWSRTDEAVDHRRRKVPEMEEGGVHRALDRHSCPSHGTCSRSFLASSRVTYLTLPQSAHLSEKRTIVRLGGTWRLLDRLSRPDHETTLIKPVHHYLPLSVVGALPDRGCRATTSRRSRTDPPPVRGNSCWNLHPANRPANQDTEADQHWTPTSPATPSPRRSPRPHRTGRSPPCSPHPPRRPRPATATPALCGTARSTPANRATTRKCTRTDSSRDAIRRNQPRTVDSGTPSSSPIRR